MKKRRIIYSSIFLLSSLILLSINKPISAAPTNNPIFATVEWVEGEIQHLLSTFNQHESQNQTDFDFINQRAESLEEENEELRNKIEDLENNSLPDGKWVHVCFDVATANLSVMKGGSCFPHVHWKIFVQCYPGTPCVPDNPADSYYVPPQEQ